MMYDALKRRPLGHEGSTALVAMKPWSPPQRRNVMFSIPRSFSIPPYAVTDRIEHFAGFGVRLVS
jgi:hypothetical protein